MMLLFVLLLFGLSLLGTLLAFITAFSACVIHRPIAVMKLAALSMTLCSFGAYWFIESDRIVVQAMVATGFSVALLPLCLAWRRFGALAANGTHTIALGLTLIPLLAIVGAVAGYTVAGLFPELFAARVATNVEAARIGAAHRWGWFTGHVVGLSIGLLVALVTMVFSPSHVAEQQTPPNPPPRR